MMPKFIKSLLVILSIAAAGFGCTHDRGGSYGGGPSGDSGQSSGTQYENQSKDQERQDTYGSGQYGGSGNSDDRDSQDGPKKDR